MLPCTAEHLVDCLRTSGYETDIAFDGQDGLAFGRMARYVVMIVDRMLPGVDGVELIRRLREAEIMTPTLIISALGEVDDRVRGLRAGGDDYLVKPFALVELLARVDALARRSAAVVNEYSSPGGLTLRELLQIIRLIGHQRAIVGAAITAYDPAVDRDGKAAQAGIAVAKELLAAACIDLN